MVRSTECGGLRHPRIGPNLLVVNAKPFPAWHPALARRILTADRLTAITDCYYVLLRSTTTYIQPLGTATTGRVDELRELGDDCYCFNIIRAIVPLCLFFLRAAERGAESVAICASRCFSDLIKEKKERGNAPTGQRNSERVLNSDVPSAVGQHILCPGRAACARAPVLCWR